MQDKENILMYYFKKYIFYENAFIIGNAVSYLSSLPNLLDETLYIVNLGGSNTIHHEIALKNKYLKNYKEYGLDDFDYYIFNGDYCRQFLFCANEDIIIEFKLRNVDFPNSDTVTWEELDNSYNRYLEHEREITKIYSQMLDAGFQNLIYNMPKWDDVV